MSAGTDLRDRFRYRGPEINTDDVKVIRFEVERQSLENLQLAMQPGGRSCLPGVYSKLLVGGRLWMSDTTAEMRDHVEPIVQADRHEGGRGLIHGLGLGCVLGCWLDVLSHVDVVERDERIADTIGAWYEKEYPGQVTVHVADCYDKKWPPGSFWDVVWHDVWKDLCVDNLTDMAKLHRSFGRRCHWQGSWGKTLLEHEKRRHRNNAWW